MNRNRRSEQIENDENFHHTFLDGGYLGVCHLEFICYLEIENWDLVDEPPLFTNRIREQRQVLIAGNFISTVMGKVRGHELCIEQLIFIFRKMFHQANERNFRSVSNPAEHRFAEESSSEATPYSQ